jgi:hexosaminidase
MRVFVHVDFKGLPLSVEHLCEHLSRLRAGGADGVFLEWEDMLPYDGELRALAAEHAYTSSEVARIVAHAETLDLEIVPLVQTLGHLEFALKDGSGFEDIRENPEDWSTVCSDRAKSFLRALILQVLSFHRSSTRVHIGCDEPALHASAATHPEGAAGVLCDHVRMVTLHLHSLGKKVLMWHDGCANMPDASLRQLLECGAQVCVWDYSPTLAQGTMEFIGRIMACSDAPVFAATAWKGADGPDSLVPDMEARRGNQRAWRELLERSEPASRFEGVVLTGWSRYGHMMPLCESFPAAVPSLSMALLVWGGEREASPWREDAEWAGVHEACLALARSRTRVIAFEEERRHVTTPLCLRGATPMCKRKFREAAARLVAEIEEAGQRAEGLLRRAATGGADVDEWVGANVTHWSARARRLDLELGDC